jgi:hypothetical protein
MIDIVLAICTESPCTDSCYEGIAESLNCIKQSEKPHKNSRLLDWLRLFGCRGLYEPATRGKRT